MISKNSKVIKYLFLFVLFVINFYGITKLSSNENTKEEQEEIVVANAPTVVEKPTLSRFLPEISKSVSHKLDSVYKRFNKRHDFHGSILVAKKGKIIYNNEYGYANFKQKTKINKNSTFQLASVSKQFTAAAIMILYERGLVGLDDSVTRYYPNFPYKKITIRHLLNHTSGLPKYFYLAERVWENKEKAPLNSEMMDLIAEQNLPLFFKPGRNFDYSNTGYMVLASVVEKVSGDDFGTFLEANIFEPLDMTKSFVYRFQQDSIQENQLDGYHIQRRWRHVDIPGYLNDGIVGDKNVYSTSEDLFKWITGLNSGKLISKESLQMMYTKGKTRRRGKVPYGFGFRIKDRKGENIIYHNGKWNGFSTSITQYMDDDLVIITLEHSSFKLIKNLNNKVKFIVDHDENFASL